MMAKAPAATLRPAGWTRPRNGRAATPPRCRCPADPSGRRWRLGRRGSRDEAPRSSRRTIMHDHADHDAQQPLDLVHAQAAAGAGLAGSSATSARRPARNPACTLVMPRGPRPQGAIEVEALSPRTSARKIRRLHAQAGFEQRLGRHAAVPCASCCRTGALTFVVRSVNSAVSWIVISRSCFGTSSTPALQRKWSCPTQSCPLTMMVWCCAPPQELGVGLASAATSSRSKRQQFARSVCASRWPCARTGPRARSRPNRLIRCDGLRT